MDDAFGYCPRCGDPLEERQLEGQTRSYCPACDRVHYRNPKPCAGVLVVAGDRLLLVERTEPPGTGTWSVPAGYLERDEPPRHAAVRELEEETNVRIDEGSLEQFDTVFVRHPTGGHVLVLVYVIAAAEAAGDVEAGDDAADARFWSLSELDESGEEIESGYKELFRAAIDSRES